MAGTRGFKTRGKRPKSVKLDVRILFDHGTPAPLRDHLGEHHIDRSAEKGWEMYENGELIRNAESEGYEVIVTTDQSMEYQQNLQNRKIGIVVLRSTAWPRIRLRVDEIRKAIKTVQPGKFEVVVI